MVKVMRNEINFDALKGKTIVKITGEKGDEEMVFHINNGDKYRLIYHHDCCASCSIEDICGDLDDLIGNPVLVAEESDNRETNPDGTKRESPSDSFTWVFYKLDTIKGGVTIRWYGESNGYYSESATFEKLIDCHWRLYE